MNLPDQTTLPSLDFVAGIISCTGTFFWTYQNNRRLPIFQIKLHASDRALLEFVKQALGLTEEIHEYTHSQRHSVLLLVRRRSTIEDFIIPILSGRLFGEKAIQFDLWKDTILQEKIGPQSNYTD